MLGFTYVGLIKGRTRNSWGTVGTSVHESVVAVFGLVTEKRWRILKSVARFPRGGRANTVGLK
ncbi:MAG: hypothetical protein VX438_07345, partial [Planctomycetota bacterium]|nr:hypothetical protein [Planctomycetota bacterium]